MNSNIAPSQSPNAPAAPLDAPIVLTPDQIQAIAGGLKAPPISKILTASITRLGFFPGPLLPKLPLPNV